MLEIRAAVVEDLEAEGALLVQDGNHGEYRPRRHEFVEDGVAFIRAADMDGGRILFDTASKINDVALQRVRKGIGAPGDVILSHKGTVGKVAWAPFDCDPFVCSPQTTFWRATEGGPIDNRYLYYFLLSPHFQNQLISRKGETSMADYVSLTSQRQLEVVIPPLDEQRRIAAVLGALDDRIEVNRRMNRTLEAMAQALFRSRFVDFDGRDDLVEHEAGPIPEGWRWEPLDKVADFLNGTACQKYPAAEGEPSLPVIKIREMRSGFTDNTDRANTEVPDRFVVEDGDMLFSWSGSLLALIWTGGRGFLNQHIFKVTSERFPRWFYYLWVHEHIDRFRHIAASKATTMGHINRKHLKQAMVAVPPPEEVDQMGSTFGPLLGRQVANDLHSRTLAALRDALLPKLVSGELRVPEAEDAVEAAV